MGDSSYREIAVEKREGDKSSKFRYNKFEDKNSVKEYFSKQDRDRAKKFRSTKTGKSKDKSDWDVKYMEDRDGKHDKREAKEKYSTNDPLKMLKSEGIDVSGFTKAGGKSRSKKGGNCGCVAGGKGKHRHRSRSRSRGRSKSRSR